MVEVSVEPMAGTMSEDLCSWSGQGEAVALWWLGQAGFAFRRGDCLGMIDPYLSDVLAAKYRGSEKPHDRLMPPPVAPEDVRGLKIVLCSHDHTDHMDPDTLPHLARNNPECEFIIPAPTLDRALEMGLPRERIRCVTAGGSIAPADLVTIHVVAAAHEDLKTDDHGSHHFIGFVIACGDLVLFHSGDCVPYEGLERVLRAFSVDVALLPVNGRDERRRGLGIIGNFDFREAAALCIACGIPVMIPHHFGMFASNTVPVAELERQIADVAGALRCVLSDAGKRIVLRTSGEPKTRPVH